MMDKELLGLFETAKKAADEAASVGGAEEGRCLDALLRLKDFPVTVQLLVSTQVGKRLRQLTKHPRKKIQTVASDLMETWRGLVIEEHKRNEEHGNLVNKDSVKVESAAKDENGSKTSSVIIEKISRAETVKIQKIDRNSTPGFQKSLSSETVMNHKRVQNVTVHKVDKSDLMGETVKAERVNNEERYAVGRKRPFPNSVSPAKLSSMIKCNDPLRDKVRELVHEALSKVSGEASEDIEDKVEARDPIRVAIEVESALFERWGRSNGAQKVKYRSLMFNIKDPKNPDFRRKVLLGLIKPEILPNLSIQEMASDKMQRENERIKERALFDCQRGGPQEATTDQFRCGRCGQRKCTYFQMQTRSADEPMTTYVTCVNCNNHWKFC